MSMLGLSHAAIGLLAILLAATILVRRKGDRLHKALGWAFVPLMAVALVTAITLGLVREFHAFNAYAALSLLALVAAVWTSRNRARVPDWRFWHGGLMSFTVFSGVVATSGVVYGMVTGVASGPAFYRAWNLVIAVLTVLGLAFMTPRLRALSAPATARQRVWAFNAGVAAASAGLIVAQAFSQS